MGPCSRSWTKRRRCRRCNFHPPHFVERVTRIQQCQGPLAPIFKQVGAPLQSGIDVLLLNIYYCIIYAEINKDLFRTDCKFAINFGEVDVRPPVAFV
jgi:hypothetical protein